MIRTSLLLLVFNGDNYLHRALDSVYKQKTKLDEIVIVNDASQDMTKIIIEFWSKKLPIKHIQNKVNIGIFKSLKKGVDNCTGKLIFRIDHDDEWSENHVSEILRLYNQENNASIFSTRANYFDKNKNFLKSSISLTDKEIRKEILWDNPLVQSATAFLKKDFLRVYKKVNLYSLEDYDLWIKLLKIGRLQFSSEITVNYYVYENSLSRQNIQRNYRERYLCQFKAIKNFFFLYPLRSIFILAITAVRYLRHVF